MKVKKNTDHTLIVEDAPWFFGLMMVLFILVISSIGLVMLLDGELAGLIFLGVGVIVLPLIAYLFIRRVQVVFYRPEGWVEIRRANLLRQSKARYTMNEVKRAVVQSTRSDNNTLYRVALVMEKAGVQDTKPLTTSYSNVGKPHASAEAINAWLGLSPDD